MDLLFAGLAIVVFGGLAALVLQRRGGLAVAVATSGAVVGSAVALVPVLRALVLGTPAALRLAWSVPFGSFSVELDALSALFALPPLVLGPLAAIEGTGRLHALRERRALGPPLFFLNLLVASMVLVVIARNGVLFLVAWEVMFAASFFLVTFDDEEAAVRDAGWVYLVATHLGTAFLYGVFVLLAMSGKDDALDFAQIGSASRTPFAAGLAFVFALVGFGTKAGFVPLHVWLPGAYPVAPNHATAVLSGAMSKMGIYGIVRFLVLLGPAPAWWGWVLVAVGLASGLIGILFALAQRDLKRLLGYSSIENVGIIALGLGVGVIGQASGQTIVSVLGFGGALLHVLNHALMKGLLFLSAGAIADATGTRDIEKLGGLLKRMPRTGALFLLGAVAISALPPLNGFASEFLIYFGAIREATTKGAPTPAAIAALVVVGGLALVGGLAAAAFARACGVVLLGEPRTPAVEPAREGSLLRLAPIGLLAAGCVAAGLAAPAVLSALAGAVGVASGSGAGAASDALELARGPLSGVVAASSLFLVLCAILAAARLWLLSGRRVESVGTWDCGYIQPTARIQYTASSFGQPLVALFSGALRSRSRTKPPKGIFPGASAHATETPDVFAESAYAPAFALIRGWLARLRVLQGGRLQVYVLYIALVLLFLLAFQL